MGTPAGHVFVVRGDVTRLACDWWLLPSGTDWRGRPGEIGDGWLVDDRVRAVVGRDEWRDIAPSGDKRAAIVAPPTTDAPGIIAVHTGEWGDESPSWFADALAAAGGLVRARSERHLAGRPVPMLALPLMGTGRGGAGDRRAGVLEQLLARAQTLAGEAIDVALVLANRQAYSAAQRLRVAEEHGELWRRTLRDDEMTLAAELADQARTGKLVPFLGAGVSAAAGLPGWRELLAKLAEPAGLVRAEEVDQLERMDPRDAARVIQQRLGGPGGELDGLLRAEFKHAERASMTHALLGSLPIREAATTNYDRLFENAWGAAVSGPRSDARNAITVLPREDASQAGRWLVKLHGDVDDDDLSRKLVLSRDDYARFEQHGGAIAGLLQAMLLTRHLLIVGYGLRDETFHRIAHGVREVGASQIVRALTDAPKRRRRLGTALLVRPPQLFGEVWSDDLQLVDLSAATEDISTAARRQDIFLDRLATLAAPVESYVLGAGWGELTSHGADQELRAALETLGQISGLDTPMESAVREVLERFGRGEDA